MRLSEYVNFLCPFYQICDNHLLLRVLFIIALFYPYCSLYRSRARGIAICLVTNGHRRIMPYAHVGGHFVDCLKYHTICGSLTATIN